MAAAEEKLAKQIAAGQTHRVKVYDKTAPSAASSGAAGARAAADARPSASALTSGSDTRHARISVRRQTLTADDVRFGKALAAAHRARTRPLCLCTGNGVAMYVARLGSGFMLKRMPGTGSLHSPRLPHRRGRPSSRRPTAPAEPWRTETMTRHH
jgi:hypothetical protein